jgi:hypothetical protein
MRLLSYAVVAWQVQHLNFFFFWEAQQPILMGLQTANTIFYEE